MDVKVNYWPNNLKKCLTVLKPQPLQSVQSDRCSPNRIQRDYPDPQSQRNCSQDFLAFEAIGDYLILLCD